jgi:hypothetical protein
MFDNLLDFDMNSSSKNSNYENLLNFKEESFEYRSN